MISYFSKSTINAASDHAIKDFPNESCGLVIDGSYIPIENLAENPTKHFSMDNSLFIKHHNKIQAIIHSHNNFPHASERDMQQQIATNVPWGVLNLVQGVERAYVTSSFFWGDTLETQDYEGRPFVHGVYDCYSLVRSFYIKDLNITLPMFPRSFEFWLDGQDLFMDNYKSNGFIQISGDDLKIGDILLGRLYSKVINHCAVYVGHNLILHHLQNRLSKIEPLNFWRNTLNTYFRYEDKQC